MPRKRKTLSELEAKWMAEKAETGNSTIPSNPEQKGWIDPERVKTVRENAKEIALKRAGSATTMTKDWMDPAHRIVCFMAACGAPRKQIALSMGYSDNQVSRILKSDLANQEIEKIQYRLFGKSPKMAFEEIMPSAIKTALQVMLDETQKGGIRLSAAQDFMDRAAGKPVQRIEQEKTSLISILISQLDEKSKPIEAREVNVDNEHKALLGPSDEFEPDEEISTEVLNVQEITQSDDKPEPQIDVNSWVDENL